MIRKTLTLALTGMVTIGTAACSNDESVNEGSSLMTVEVTRGDLSIRAEATGTVEPIRTVEVKSKASGEILRLHADVGDQVGPGSLLADIDPRDVQNRFNQTEADLAVAQARLEISEAQLDRSNQLLEAAVITPQEHESSRLEFANSQASLVKAKTNHDLAILQLNDVRIRAPTAGTIIQKSVEEGVVIQSASQNVSGGTALFLMANLKEMQVRTLVDETDMGQLASGLEAIVTVEAFPDQSFRGVVDKIEPQATVVQNVTMFPVIVSLDNNSGLLKPGMNAEVQVLIDEALDVVLVPNNAIVQISDVGPAAMALGLNIDEMDLTQFMRGGRGGSRGGQGFAGGRGQGDGPQSPGAEATGGADDSPSGDGQDDQGSIMAQLQELRAQVESGEISQESMRAEMQRLGGGRGGRAGAAQRRGGADVTRAPTGDTRPAVVFVMGADSIPKPRLVQMGLNDWDHTQIVMGVEAGDVLVVVGAAQLMAQQQEFQARMMSRMGGNLFGGGMGGGGSRGFRPRTP
ncbi:MAG: efflux RND transporter periplasmic adaptor subunit [bacterium]|nr:efflux RND transporter periplasmic adaptor subunit [Gemmatimonadota bacterium]HIL90672.1 efflux RND transporter periplasmic adaptor subunit [Gemmatimonadota bacterium]